MPVNLPALEDVLIRLARKNKRPIIREPVTTPLFSTLRPWETPWILDLNYAERYTNYKFEAEIEALK
jgi:hypothetical protein